MCMLYNYKNNKIVFGDIIFLFSMLKTIIMCAAHSFRFTFSYFHQVYVAIPDKPQVHLEIFGAVSKKMIMFALCIYLVYIYMFFFNFYNKLEYPLLTKVACSRRPASS